MLVGLTHSIRGSALIALAALSGGCADDDPCTRDSDCRDGRCEDGQCQACTADATPCGRSCCSAGELCAAEGCISPEVCAPPRSTCDSACCSAESSCLDGACCSAARACGAECCSGGERCFGGSSCCPSARDCGTICCGAGELCDSGVCRKDCGGVPACGGSGECCGSSEICLMGRCVAPGNACGAAACLTRVDSGECPGGQICEPTLGRCIPKLADDACSYRPPPGRFDPVPVLSWGERRERVCAVEADCQRSERCSMGRCQITWRHVTPAIEPDYHQVTSAPMIADLDRDCVPEIIFNSYRASAFTRNGILRAIRGTDGSELFSLTDREWRTNGTANPAVGDLDGDGSAEIVVDSEVDGRLLLIGADGSPIWRSDALREPTLSGSPSIANFDADGAAEIAYGSAVLDATGRIAFEGDLGWFDDQGPISCVADVDGDGRPELISGNTAYQFTGKVSDGTFAGRPLWTLTSSAGYCGIADLDVDGRPEVVFVGQRSVRVVSGQTGQLLGEVSIPGNGHGGAPNIGDFDGDGYPDIGTAGSRNYAVFRWNRSLRQLEVLWTAQTEDNSSQRTGSSVFDFDGDGRAEVVYNDEEYLRVYPGVEPDCRATPPGPDCDAQMTDAEILFRDLSSSRTRTEYPIIAAVNGDFKAEIVFSTSNEASFLDPLLVGDAGIEVWKDRLDNWVPTRPIWNQHSYHVTNVEVDGSIPRLESDSWTSSNTYRANTQGRMAFCAPDLVVAEANIDARECPALFVSAWVQNRGCLGVGPGVKVSVRSGVAELASAVTEDPLLAGESARIQVRVETAGGAEVQLVVDDPSAVNECSEQNNALSIPNPCG